MVLDINVAATGRRIKETRLAHKVKVTELQEHFGFTNPNTIYKWEKGECLPSMGNMLGLAKFYECSMEDLLVSYGDAEDSVPQGGRGIR